MPKHVVAIHQPNFFPWAGYFDKLARCDSFIFLDDVQYPKTGGSWSNRTAILVNAASAWLTAPLARNFHGTRILSDMHFRDADWATDATRKLHGAYGKAPYYAEALQALQPLLHHQAPHLAAYNTHVIRALCALLNIKLPPIIDSSQLACADTGTARLISLIKAVGGTHYLCGGGSAGYLDEDAFAQAGIGLVFQQFTPLPYAQKGTEAFVPGLSVIDMLMQLGFEGARAHMGLQLSQARGG